MDDNRLQEEVAGATAYEALHVPAVFSEWTSRVLDAAELFQGVLEYLRDRQAAPSQP